MPGHTTRMRHIDLSYHLVPVRAFRGETTRWLRVEDDGISVTMFLGEPQIQELIRELQATIEPERSKEAEAQR